MNVSSSHKRFWESPRDYIGELPTTGKGVGVMVLDQGFDTSHPDLKGRVIEVATSPQDVFDSDPVGHGTLVLGIVGADGSSSNGEIKGVAPDATLIAARVNVNEKTDWKTSSASVATAIDWAVKNKDEFNIKVINCSFVHPMVERLDPATRQVAGLFDPLGYSLQMAFDAGITVVAGVGNFGDKQPIMTPAGNPNVIAVGALDTNGTPEDTSDDTVAHFSSRGLSSEGKPKPDILAPGVNIMSTNASGSSFEQRNTLNTKFATVALRGPMKSVKIIAQKQIQKGWLPASVMGLPDQELRHEVLRCYEVKGSRTNEEGVVTHLAQDGSSEASPIVAGVVANMLEANPSLTPDEVREILYSTTRPVEGDPLATGRGAIDAQRAVAEALRRRQ